MNMLRKMANLTKNMSSPNKGKGNLSELPRSKSTNANPSNSTTRTLKSKSTSAMESKSNGLMESIRNRNISRHRTRSVVRIPIRSVSTTSGDRMQTLDDICYFMNSNKVKNVVVMAGAGISTSSGIPDFRTPGTGLYDNLHQYKIPYPEAIFDIDYFHYNPRPFFTLAKELYPSGVYQPNAVHHFCRLLYDKDMLLRMYTQNIDGLERTVGIPPSKLVEAHGTFASATCVSCRKKYDGEEIKHDILTGKLPLCRSTRSCKGIIKPDIVFFGEELPNKFWLHLKDFPQADMLIVMGTSLEVEPFAGLVDYTRFPVPRILFNQKLVGPFKKRRRMNDVAITGDLVENVSMFVRRLGWEKEFNKVSGQPLQIKSSGSHVSESETANGDEVKCSKNINICSSKVNGAPSMNGEHPANAKIITILKQEDISSPVNSKNFHSVSSHPHRLLTKRGSTGSLIHQSSVQEEMRGDQKKQTLPKLDEAQKRVNAYKETLEKLRKWRLDSTSESSSTEATSESSSD